MGWVNEIQKEQILAISTQVGRNKRKNSHSKTRVLILNWNKADFRWGMLAVLKRDSTNTVQGNSWERHNNPECFKTIESMFSDHKRIKLEMNNQMISGKGPIFVN